MVEFFFPCLLLKKVRSFLYVRLWVKNLLGYAMFGQVKLGKVHLIKLG